MNEKYMPAGLKGKSLMGSSAEAKAMPQKMEDKMARSDRKEYKM